MSIELLAPAGNKEALIAAVQSGADAVYLGTQMLNARAGAGNFDAEALKWACDYAHERGVSIHVTVNTMVKQNEAALVEQVARQIAAAGADAAIVQDMGVVKLLRAMLPSLAIHASTQMAVHNRQGVQFARDMGLDRVVLAREMSFEEIAGCAEEGIELETFAHGALCVSCSGQCLFSSLIGGRSGNRGQCAQPCRLPYRLEGAVKANGYLLSPKDLMTLDHLVELRDAGVCSLKIEGRLKRPEYVAVVTRAYREALDLLESYDDYAPEEEIREALAQIFNRGGFTQGYGPGLIDRELMSPLKPNHAGLAVGELTAPGKIRLTKDVSAADSLAFRDKTGAEFPVKGVSGHAGDVVRTKTPDGARPGTALWRLVSDEQMKSARESVGGENRRTYVSGFLKARVGENMALSVTDDEFAARVEGGVVEEATGRPADAARVKAQLMKTGNVPYEFINLSLGMDDNAFLSASALNDLRRRALEEISRQRIAARRGCKAEIKNMPEMPDPDHEKPEKTCLRVQSSDFSVLADALKNGADEVIFLPEDLTYAGLDAAAADTDFSFTLALPQTMGSETLGELCEWAHDHRERICAYLISNPSQLALEWPGEIQLDSPLNLAGRHAMDVYMREGASLYTPSVELNAGEIRAMGEGGRRELIVYGRMQLMSLRHCPLRAQGDGKHIACHRCDTVSEDKCLNAHKLIDRTETAFPLRRQKSEEGCIIRLMNSVPTMVLRHAGKLPSAASWRLIMTDETKQQARDIVRLHRMALDGKDFRASGEWARVENLPSTTGHYFRGVE